MKQVQKQRRVSKETTEELQELPTENSSAGIIEETEDFLEELETVLTEGEETCACGMVLTDCSIWQLFN